MLLVVVPKHRITALEAVNATNQEKFKNFSRIISYYRKFVSGIANSTALLTPFTNRAAPARVRWTREMEVNFSEFKKILYKMSVLNVPSPDD